MGPLGFSADTIIAAMAVVVALISGAFTAYQAYLSRRHNRLSVKPHITTWLDEEEKTEIGFTGKLESTYILCCDVMNNGIGPAIIRKYTVYFDGKPIGDNADIKVLEKAIGGIIDAQKWNCQWHVSITGKDYPFPAGERTALLRIKIPMHLQFDKTPYLELMDRFDAIFEYECMYGNKFTHQAKPENERKLAQPA